jgi:DNA repair protein RadD
MLRSYQNEAVEAVYRHLRERDDNPVVVLPTGAGKSWYIAQMATDAVSQWNGRVLILAHRKELLEQNADKIRRLCPDLRVGIYSAGLKRRDTDTPVLVAGIQSICRRACEFEPFDLVIVDECHLIPRDGEGMYRQFLREATIVNPHLRTIGLTATPYRLDSGPICDSSTPSVMRSGFAN